KVTELVSPDANYGFIVRTQAECATQDELLADKEYLCHLWSSIQTCIRKQPAPSLLYCDLALEQRVLRDRVRPNTGNILVDSRTTTQELFDWAQQYTPSVVDRIRHYSGERPLFDTANVDDEIAGAMQRRVNLKSGGYLIIDQTE